MATTPTYAFNLPTVGGDINTWGTLLNSNWTNLDNRLNGTTALTGTRIADAVFTGTTSMGSADINGGTIDGTVIGGTVAAAGTFTALTSTGIDDNAAATAVTIDASGNVGIGTSTPDELLELSANTGAAIKITSTDVSLLTGETIGSIKFESNDSSGVPPHTSGQIDVIAEDDFGRGAMAFSTGRNLDFQEAMRIDASGNVLVGTTDLSVVSSSTSGITLRGPLGLLGASRDSNESANFNRYGTDGDVVKFRKDGTTVGSIGAISGDVYMANNTRGFKINAGGNNVTPADGAGGSLDNVMDLGASSNRWDDIFATNGTIQTSDRNEKQDIASLAPTEMLVGARLSKGFKNFKWKDSVAEKGAAARTHSGAIAQDVQDAFTAEGLDAGDYSMFTSATWWTHDVDVPAVEAVAEVVDEEGNVVTEAVEAVAAYTRTDTYDTEAEVPVGATERTRLGVRYPELLSFVAAYNEQRFTALEDRITALEATT